MSENKVPLIKGNPSFSLVLITIFVFGVHTIEPYLRNGLIRDNKITSGAYMSLENLMNMSWVRVFLDFFANNVKINVNALRNMTSKIILFYCEGWKVNNKVFTGQPTVRNTNMKWPKWKLLNFFYVKEWVLSHKLYCEFFNTKLSLCWCKMLVRAFFCLSFLMKYVLASLWHLT